MKNVKKLIASVVTLALVGSAMVSIPANADTNYTATLEGTVGTGQFWDDNASTVAITGDGQYSISFEFSEATQASEGSGAIILDTDINPYDYIDEDVAETLSDNEEIAKATGITISVDNILVDGTEIAYNGPSAGAYVNEKSNLRLNIYNVWGNDVKDIPFDFNVESEIVVNFTITGLDGDATIGDSDGELPIVTSTPNEEVKVDYTLYESVIDKASQVVTEKGYNNLTNENGKLGYYLYDINGDGVKELIIAEDFSETKETSGNVTQTWVSGYYDVYTIVNGKVVEIDQTGTDGKKTLAVAANSYLSEVKDADIVVKDGKLAYVRTVDNSDTVQVLYITGYTKDADGTLKLTLVNGTGNKADFPQLTLYDYTDKTPVGGSKDDSPNTSESTTTTTTASPDTGDAGVGTVALAFAVAGLSAIALRKKD
jgi:hypothetical protein